MNKKRRFNTGIFAVVAAIGLPFLTNCFAGKASASSADIDFSGTSYVYSPNKIHIDEKHSITVLTIASELGGKPCIDVILPSADEIFEVLTKDGIRINDLDAITTSDKKYNELAGNYIYHRNNIDEKTYYNEDMSFIMDNLSDKIIRACSLYTISVIVENLETNEMELKNLDAITIKNMSNSIHLKSLKKINPLMEEINHEYQELAKLLDSVGAIKDIEMLRAIKIKMAEDDMYIWKNIFSTRVPFLDDITDIRNLFDSNGQLSLDNMFALSKETKPDQLYDEYQALQNTDKNKVLKGTKLDRDAKQLFKDMISTAKEDAENNGEEFDQEYFYDVMTSPD